MLNREGSQTLADSDALVAAQARFDRDKVLTPRKRLLLVTSRNHEDKSRRVIVGVVTVPSQWGASIINCKPLQIVVVYPP